MENDPVKAIEEALKDPENNTDPKFFLKISNSYYMSMRKYTGLLKDFMHEHHKRASYTKEAPPD